MTRLLHVSDLHFGWVHERMLAPLARALQAQRGDLLIVSGDLTQRARVTQFWQAQRFLAGLQLPVMMVPGNHDVPLHNPVARLCWPFCTYRRHAAGILTPGLRIDGLRIVSLNTADPGRWRRGKLRAVEIDAALAQLKRDHDRVPGILVCHHPLITPPGFRPGETRGPVEESLQALAAQGVRIVLSGHLHHWNIGQGITAETPQPILHVQTGTALCAREGERDHGFAVLELSKNRLDVTRHLWDETQQQFLPEAARPFVFSPQGWRPL